MAKQAFFVEVTDTVDDEVCVATPRDCKVL